MKAIKKLILTLTMSIIAINTVNAQYHQKAGQNPFTLVYDGAITENVKDLKSKNIMHN